MKMSRSSHGSWKKKKHLKTCYNLEYDCWQIISYIGIKTCMEVHEWKWHWDLRANMQTSLYLNVQSSHSFPEILRLWGKSTCVLLIVYHWSSSGIWTQIVNLPLFNCECMKPISICFPFIVKFSYNQSVDSWQVLPDDLECLRVMNRFCFLNIDRTILTSVHTK